MKLSTYGKLRYRGAGLPFADSSTENLLESFLTLITVIIKTLQEKSEFLTVKVTASWNLLAGVKET